ncbi:5'-nucleotidase domain-containing protein 1-like isoform X1 [Argiope bruennichi]|uniref:5'-nucleotidase domain-containing protein 1 n=1 Tax=Argiope bruennichi TaxID=94029 RepID=A0A8T0EYD7_ARGBR|nr:5'-nucleotidase domain-containing protein 1-like isoform X1 [Argiope bruennichi]KAF8781648.1 5'-nucleotidase domain-containing protein 1 [Argiope bruennichi]
MFSIIAHRGKSTLWIRTFLRSHSTKLTYAQSTCPQEFALENYNCIGFDLDHTLCRYKLKPLFQLIYKSLTSFLIEKYEYPKSLAELSETDLSFAQKGIVLDKRRGNFLKLDGLYRIVKASHGTRLMSPEEIIQTYGPSRIWEESKGIPHKLVESRALEEPFYVFKDYFVTPGAVICAKVVDILDEREGKRLEEYDFWNQYIEGIFYMYERSNFRNNSGRFFPELIKNPDSYLQPCPESVKKWLENICQNKVTFLLTSANYDSAEFVAKQCLGGDWQKYFDIVITFAKKPGFFWKKKPFCLVDGNNEIGDIKPKDMKSHLVYSQGNFKELQEVCAILSKTECPKTLYFGDSLIEDVYAASEVAGCDTVAIVEEMLAEGIVDFPHKHPESQTLTSTFWGSFFSNKIASGNQGDDLSLWAHLLSQHSKLTVPNLESLAGLQMQDKIASFGGDASTSGYFPGVPKSLSTC